MNKESFLQAIRSTCVYNGDREPIFLYWYPLADVKDNIPVVAYNLDAIYSRGDVAQLEKVLTECSIHNVISVQNQDSKIKPEKIDLLARLYESDSDGYNFPWYVENYYYDITKAWLIYVSHEGTVTFAGEQITEIAKKTIDSKYKLNQIGERYDNRN